MNNAFLNDFTIDKENCTVTVKRSFSASQKLVWRTWTEAELLDQWWGPKPYNAVTKSMDFSVGGRRVYAMVSPEGQEHFSIQEYTSISPVTNFKFISAFTDKDGNPDLPGSEWSVDLSEQNGITTVIVTIYNESHERMEQMIEMGFKEGFTVCLDQLGELLKEQE
jgi:uncharacterized protein YndB with AHSA1/START domain